MALNDIELSLLINDLQVQNTVQQEALDKQRANRMRKFIRDIPKNFVTREEYDSLVLCGYPHS